MTLNAAINWGLNKVISKTIVLLTGKNLSTLQKIVNVLWKAANGRASALKAYKDLKNSI